MKLSSMYIQKNDSSRILLLFTFIFFLFSSSTAQPFTFAHVTDTHVGGASGAEDLRLTVADINSQPAISFVILSGDITEFGSGDELTEAKAILDGLKKPYYVLPGNHDSKWSESGCNDFVRIFGSETFAFEKNGFLFTGTASGPVMRMAPALVPREQLLYLDSVLTSPANQGKPVIYINHYPLDDALSNSRKVIGQLLSANIKASLCGHGHTDRVYNFGGIPGVMGRSNLRNNSGRGGYNLCTIERDTLFYAGRITGKQTNPVWCRIPVSRSKTIFSETKPQPSPDTTHYETKKVYPVWHYTEKCDIGSGIAAKGVLCVTTTADGRISARDIGTGKRVWEFATGGKTFSTPAIKGNRVVCPSTDGTVYCLSLKDGQLLWRFKTGKSIVASPVISGKTAYTGSSEGKFRAINIRNGKLKWEYDSVRNFVETKPLVYKKGVFFGSWGNTFYSLDRRTGALLWKREKYANRMLSPAAVWPVASGGKVFIVAPDRRMTALDAKTGKEIWDSGKYSCRESIGISRNKKLVYIKNMTEGNIDAFEAKADSQKIVWECKAGLGYEIAPSPITEANGLVFIPTTSGTIVAIDAKKKQVAWKYKASDALINHILPIYRHRLLVTTFDGQVACLSYR